MPFAESSLNEESGKLFMDNYQEYYKIAKLYTNIYAVDNNSKIHSNLNIHEMNIFDGKNEVENKKIILANDNFINNENNILSQKNTNDNIDKSLGKKFVKPLPICNNDFFNINENSNNFISNNKFSNSDKKESKSNLRTFELFRTNSNVYINSNVTITNNYNAPVSSNSETKNGKKDDIKKWISRI